MWHVFNVQMVFEEKLCGSVPQSKELVRPWLEARMPKIKPDGAVAVDVLEEEVLESIAEAEERVTLGFQRDEAGLYVRSGTIKAHLKDCANQIKDVLKIRALRSKVANKVYVEPYKIYLLRDGAIVREEDEQEERPVRAMTPRGPISALKIIRYVYRPVLRFQIKILEDTEVTAAVVREVFNYGCVHGYGGERGMGEGRYNYDLSPCEEAAVNE